MFVILQQVYYVRFYRTTMTIVSYLSHSYYGFFIVFSLKNPSISIHLKAEIIYFFFFYSSSDTKSKILDCSTWLDFCAIYFGDEYKENLLLLKQVTCIIGKEIIKCLRSIFNTISNKVTSSDFCANSIIIRAENSAGEIAPIMQYPKCSQEILVKKNCILLKKQVLEASISSKCHR